MTTRDPADLARQRREIRDYWNAHPISTDSVEFEKGSEASFAALYERWRAGADATRFAFRNSCDGLRVLEVGCGIGLDARFLREVGVDHTAVDYSRESLRLAKRHFDLAGLTGRFTNGDAVHLPLPDDHFDLAFSIGVLHHVPEMSAACRELVRVVRPGGSVRVMLYNRASYHYALVMWVVRPLIWLLLSIPGLSGLGRLGPRKLRELVEVCRAHGFDTRRILSSSTDSSTAGAANHNPLSHLVTEREMRDLFPGLEDYEFWRSDLKYYPLPFGRRFVESRFGFFLTMTARKPAGPEVPGMGA